MDQRPKDVASDLGDGVAGRVRHLRGEVREESERAGEAAVVSFCTAASPLSWLLEADGAEDLVEQAGEGLKGGAAVEQVHDGTE